MTKIDDAIKHFKVRANKGTHNQIINDSVAIVDALEEIRDTFLKVSDELYTLKTGQANTTEEQPATFLPWHDVVEIVGPTFMGSHDFVGFEGFVTDFDGSDYGVQMSDQDDNYYFAASSLKFVYRLKPRAQVASQPLFKAGEYVQNGYGDVFEVMADVLSGQLRAQCRQINTNQPCAISIDSLQRIDAPAPFQVGDWVRDHNDLGFQIEEIGEQWAYSTTPDDMRIARRVEKLTKIPAPATFAVGDWVRHKHSHKAFQISSVAGEQIYGMLEGTIIATLQEFVEKIPAPAPRFTFGDRVRIEWGEIDHIFLGYDIGAYGSVIGPSRDIFSFPLTLITHAPLDTSAD